MAFKSIKLKELCSSISYGYTESASQEVVGPKFLRITDIQGGVVNWESVPYCPIDDSKLKKYKLNKGDIVVARTGNSTGENYYFDSEEESVFASYLIRFQVNNQKVNPYYVWLNMRTKDWQNFVLGSKSGSAQAGANAKVLGNYEIKLIDRPVQDKLSAFIFAVNKKIELNRQINQTLEAMAQAIFKSWFVDFEPVKAKMQALENGGTEDDANLAAMQAISGKTADQLASLKTQHPDQYQQLHHTASLFPTAMQDSELGEIPAGWGVAPFSEIATLNTKSVKPNKQAETIWEHYSIPAFDSGQQPSLDSGDSIKSNKYVVQQSAILSSKLNPSTERTWLPFIENVETAICSTEFMQFVPINADDRAFAYCMIRSEPFQHGILSRITGTTGSRQRAQPKEVSVIQVVKPIPDLTTVFNLQVTPWLNIIGNNQKQIKTLSELRDTLLPKLLSGELQISAEDAA